jgi:hypothetical protein
MKFSDIENQNSKWVENCQFTVREVGKPYDSDYGLSQAISVTDSDGIDGYIYVYLTDPVFEVDSDFVGKKWFRVRCKDGVFNGYPVEDGVDTDDKWDKINFGKCRHGILVACIQAGFNIHDLADDKKLQETINRLAQFSMYGKVETDLKEKK